MFDIIEIMDQNDKSYSTNNLVLSKEVEEFEETKAGVKGLVDSGVVKIPSFFVIPPEILQKGSRGSSNIALEVPLIDLNGYEGGERRKEIVNDIRIAAETWGFFQMVNHGVSKRVMEDLIKGIRLFHEQNNEEKMKWYSHDHSTKNVRYYSYGYFQSSKPANWRDTLTFNSSDGQLDPDGLPLVCRREISEYMKSTRELKEKIPELLSEALGLKSDYLSNIKCMKSESFFCHYYPVCPEPEKTLGVTNHSDPYFLTILLQDNIGGLQVLHQNQWIDVPHIDGALVVNIGDFMQIITNDRFKSVEHRVLARNVGPRISAACFLIPSSATKRYGPIKELISESQGNPPLYREVCYSEYMSLYRSKGLDGLSTIPYFKL